MPARRRLKRGYEKCSSRDPTPLPHPLILKNFLHPCLHQVEWISSSMEHNKKNSLWFRESFFKHRRATKIASRMRRATSGLGADLKEICRDLERFGWYDGN